MPRCSVVVPLRNEADSLEELCRGVHEVMAAVDPSYELLLADDGSDDGTAERFRRLAPPSARLLSLPRRGKAEALQAGFDAARGELIVTLDGDLQDDPADIPRLLAALDEGCDLAIGWRRERRDAWTKRAASALANGLRRLLFGERVHDVGCPLRAFRKEAVRGLRLRGGLHRWLTALAAARGFRVEERPVSHRPRRHGASRYANLPRAAQSLWELPLVLRELRAARLSRSCGRP
jgi:glycosyltransferase involved in cell wall biosynthesis